MSKKRRNKKQKQKNEEISAEIESAESEAAEDAVSAETPTGQAPESDETPSSQADQPTPEDAAPAASFGDAGTEYIEGFLREELGLDGDLTDDEFAIAALDFLGDGPVEGGTVYFDPTELSQLAGKDLTSDEDDPAADAFAKSVEELEEAIAAVENPKFKDEGTVMMSLPDSVADDVLADANAALDDVLDKSEADAIAEEVMAEVEAEAVADVADEIVADASIEGALVDDAPADDVLTDAVAEREEAVAEVEPEAVAEVADVDAVESVVEEAVADAVVEETVEAVPAVSAAEQAEMDEALAELLEIQAMLDDDAAIEAVSEEAVAISEEIVAEVAVPDPMDAIGEVVDDAVLVELEPVAQADLSEDMAAIDEALASAESMIIDVDEQALTPEMSDADLAAELLGEQPLKFDVESIADALAAEADASNNDPLLDALPSLTEFDDSNDYLDSIVAALDAEVSELNVGQSSDVNLQVDGINDADIEQVIVFSIGNSTYAIPIDNVLEIGEPLNATEVPFVPNWVRGVINLRGEIISLVDLRVYFDADPDTMRPAEWMIVTQTSDASMLVGFIVDDVVGNRQFNRNEIAQLSSDVEDASIEFLQHIYRQDDGLVAVLDFDRLLRSSDMRQFEPV